MTLESNATRGQVGALFQMTAHGSRPRPVTDVKALVDRGLEGDLHSDGLPGKARQVLLVDAGDLSTLGLEPGDLREQITVSMPGLMNAPPGSLLAIGEAVLEIIGPCDPCTHIGGLLDRPDVEDFRETLVGRRGMLARVSGLQGEGRIAVGDPVRVSGPARSA